MRSNLNTAREKVAALRQALLSPTAESIEASLPGLVEAAACLDPDDPQSLRLLKDELQAVQQLIDHGGKLNRGLARILGAKVAGYTATGEAGALSVTGTISIAG
jgi:hypothetical protein